MVRYAWLLALPLSSIARGSKLPESTMVAVDLRCEYRREPLGVDSKHPRLGWILNAPPTARGVRQTAYRILVSSSPALLARNRGDLWDSGERASAEQNNIAYDGKPLKSGQICFWKVRLKDADRRTSAWSAPASWEMGLLDAQDWVGKWLNDGKSAPSTDAQFYAEDPAPLFRKPFALKRTIKRARLYITGLGYYEATLNGTRVGDHELDPGWTKFDKRAFYSTYDVTHLVAKGENCLGVTLGNGWYNPLPLRMWGNLNVREHLTTGRPRFIAQLRVEYADGKSETISSDLSWKLSEGPILRNSIYLGEVYDARHEQPGWDKPGYDDSEWRRPSLAPEKVGQLVAQPQPPIRITSHWNSVKMTEPQSGVFIYDMGRNFAGWARLKLNLPKGTRIVIRYGELLHADGTLNPMTSVAGQIKSRGVGGPGAPDIAWQSDTFIAKGGEEVYTPRFTFHGFRYAEITGLPKALPLASVTALRLNADVDEVGVFACSNPLLNQVQEMCRNTFLSNLFSVQSDCPHRERMGYGGDIVATSEAVMDNFDMSNFYGKAVHDWSDSALGNGMFTDTAPFMGIQYCGVVWAMAHPVLLTHLRRYYGNRALIDEQYEAAKRWLLLVEKQNPGAIVQEGLSDHESLAPAPSPEMVTPLYYQSAKLLAAMAHQLSRTADEAHFQRLADSIRKAYQAKFVDQASGKVGPGTQASQALGLETGIVADSDRSKALGYLVRDIEDKHAGHLSTGILGTKFTLDVLSREGHADLACRIATQPDFPGWGWMLKNGATTLWEHWELSDNTFSHNHPMFGSVSQWMMNWLGGIQPAEDAVGYDKVVIRPQTVAGLDWVNSSYRSIRGKIVSNWRRRGDAVTFDVEIPVNTKAHVFLPAHAVNQIEESGRKLSQAPGVSVVHAQGPSVEVVLGSGRYRFVVQAGG